jgi:hypothetical protein
MDAHRPIEVLTLWIWLSKKLRKVQQGKKRGSLGNKNKHSTFYFCINDSGGCKVVNGSACRCTSFHSPSSM